MSPTDSPAFHADDAELERFAQIFDHLGIGLVLHAGDGSPILRNGVASRLLGDDPATGWTDEDGEALPAAAWPPAQVIATGQTVRDRIVGIAEGGKPRLWLKINAVPIFAADGGVRRVMVTLVDVSKRKQLENTVQELSVRDPETGVFTYPYALHLLEEEIHRARRYGTPFSLAVIEVDKLPEVERRIGEEALDALLAGIARLARETLREIDIVARKSRSTILVVLPNVRMNDGIIGLERVRARVETDAANASEGITISGGVTEYASESVAALIERAESLLEHAREAGPNHFCLDVEIF